MSAPPFCQIQNSRNLDECHIDGIKREDNNSDKEEVCMKMPELTEEKIIEVEGAELKLMILHIA